MSSDLQSIAPEHAFELYLDSRRDDAAEWTLTSHTSRLRPFVEWCDDNDIDDMNDLTGRDLYEYRVWRREGNYSEGKVEELAPKTLKTSLSTLRRFLRFCHTIEGVPEDLYLKVPIPELSRSDEVSDSKIVPERIPPILEYLTTYHYASRDHVVTLLLWHCGARNAAVRALDLQDVDLDADAPMVRFVHRPDTGTPLKNDEKSERANRLGKRVAKVLRSYIEDKRRDIQDDNGRDPLITTNQGRISRSSIRNTIYRVTRPCWIGEGCPHGKEIETCEYNTYHDASKCPSTRSPHDFRKARVTKFRNDNVPKGVVSDELDASEQILDLHYDRASQKQRAKRRFRELNR
ncbi:site-specific integrase [Halorubellus sp. JP-L1]|uniref:tyrosine-type recombinase/integrase n=1 Tax=Halorubellus sp. JP-L1 TaxID=2715753 RepID=UPI0014092B12|nr:site-specific integrase [Halorubellus sp. JP-L1]NHN40074.1 site-specific integrase [Halorubellus sp. JP-L1]